LKAASRIFFAHEEGEALMANTVFAALADSSGAHPSAMVRWKRSILPLVCGRYGRVRFGLMARASQVSRHR
jgi:hypothetical protein